MSLGYVDNYGNKTETFPANPNGSPLGITGLTNQDSRFTIMMPHPERCFRAVHGRPRHPRLPWLNAEKSTLQELAECYSVSTERIRQLEKNAMRPFLCRAKIPAIMAMIKTASSMKLRKHLQQNPIMTWRVR